MSFPESARPSQGSPSQASSHLPPRCPVSGSPGGPLPWEELSLPCYPESLLCPDHEHLGSWATPAEVRSGCPRLASVPPATCHSLPVFLRASMGSETSRLSPAAPTEWGATSAWIKHSVLEMDDGASSPCLPGGKLGSMGTGVLGQLCHAALSRPVCGLEDAAPHEAAPINCLLPMSSPSPTL